MSLCCELKAVDAMNDFGSSGHGSRCYEQLWAMVNMNDFESWAPNIICYEQLKAIDYERL